jgi:hypothetical protein
MLRGFIRCWESEQKCCTPAEFGFDPDMPAMIFDDPFNQSQADACAFDGWIEPVE